MMIRVKGVSFVSQILKERFACDLPTCKGACCVVGDTGAPVTPAELRQIEANLEVLTAITGRPYEVGKVATWESDGWKLGLRHEDGGCMFLYEEGDIHLCSLQRAHTEGRFPFPKPLSCHLFPVVDATLRNGDRLITVERRETCEGCFGKGPPVAEFLKEPLQRAFGKEVVRELGRRMSK